MYNSMLCSCYCSYCIYANTCPGSIENSKPYLTKNSAQLNTCRNFTTTTIKKKKNMNNKKKNTKDTNLKNIRNIKTKNCM